MRFPLSTFLPYCLIVGVLFMSPLWQDRIILFLQESKMLFWTQSVQKKESTPTAASIQSLVPEEAVFHEALDGFSPWCMARVVAHKESPWSHMAWIDIGSTTQGLPFAIEPNCPVVYGRDVVGIVEQVGSKASLIRLVSDSLLRPSVQVLRYGHNKEIEQALLFLVRQLKKTPQLLPKAKQREVFLRLLSEMHRALPIEQKLFLAKGELQGAISLQTPTLVQGVGFNYDTGDEYSFARDLRTGQDTPNGPKIPLIQPQDLLVTNGLDGLFPRGLHVARVEKVLPLEEGGFAQNVEAYVTCSCFLDLSQVAVLPKVPVPLNQKTPDLDALLSRIDHLISE